MESGRGQWEFGSLNTSGPSTARPPQSPPPAPHLLGPAPGPAVDNQHLATCCAEGPVLGPTARRQADSKPSRRPAAQQLVSYPVLPGGVGVERLRGRTGKRGQWSEKKTRGYPMLFSSLALAQESWVPTKAHQIACSTFTKRPGRTIRSMDTGKGRSLPSNHTPAATGLPTSAFDCTAVCIFCFLTNKYSETQRG